MSPKKMLETRISGQQMAATHIGREITGYLRKLEYEQPVGEAKAKAIQKLAKLKEDRMRALMNIEIAKDELANLNLLH